MPEKLPDGRTLTKESEMSVEEILSIDISIEIAESISDAFRELSLESDSDFVSSIAYKSTASILSMLREKNLI